MKKVKMTCIGAQITLETDCEKVIDYFLHDEEFVKETIPGLATELISNETDTKDSPRITYIDTQDKNVWIDPEKNEASISLPQNELYLPDLVYLSLSMFAKELNKVNKYFVHCAVVEKDGKGVILVGDAGSGKTTLAVYLCTEKGYHFVCNDRAVIGLENNKPFVYAGTLQTHIRIGVIHEFFPTLASKIDSSKMNKPWSNKIYINPEFDKLGIKVCNTSGVSDIFHVFTYPVSKSLTYIDEYDKHTERDASLLKTMGYLSEYIRADRNIIIAGNYPFPSFDTRELSQKRLSYVNNIVDNVGMYDARGNVKHLADMIDEIVSKSMGV